MQEIIEQLLDLLKGIWNKRWYAMAISWLVCLLGWGIIAQMPDQYQTKAKIYIDTQSLLKPLLRGLTVQTNMNQQIQLMVRTLLSRPNVEKIIRLADLDLYTQNQEEFDALVNKLQKEIKFFRITRGENLYDLTYTDSDREQGQDILQAVITVFIENSIGESRDESDSARTFLNKQIKIYEKRLLSAEDRLKNFKQKYVGMLPSSTGDYFSRMQNSSKQLEEAKLVLREAEMQKEAIQAEIDGEVPSFGLSPKRMMAQMETPYDARIEKLEQDLDSLLLQYTDHHPDVGSVKRVLKSLKKQRDKEISDLMEEESKTNANSNYSLNENPVFQQLKITLGELIAEEVTLKVRVAEYEKRYLAAQEKVNTVPEIEAKRKALNRDYDIIKTQYDEFLSRKESAAIAQRVDQTTDSVQFKVIEAPRVEPKPVGPQRILFSSIVLVVGLAAGLASAFLLSQLRPVILSANELLRMTGLPLLGCVSVITSPDQHRRKILLIMSYFSLLLLLLVIYAVLIGWYIMR
ncbi:MAG: hypothetical protein KAI02_00420 [Gammaproteobacteria bacterium]|nr:hypothetical protein [Gammaproteobacteria bacterium]